MHTTNVGSDFKAIDFTLSFCRWKENLREINVEDEGHSAGTLSTARYHYRHYQLFKISLFLWT